MLEVKCSSVTPEVVLKASGHVEKFTDLMVKDEKTGTCFWADHLLKDFCKEKLEKDLSLPVEKLYARPETAQGIFVNFLKLYNYKGNKLPFAAAQIGQAFRNEISPRQGLLRVREFTLAEIEHFVDPEDKSHPKFADVANLEFLMFPREEQISGQQANKFCLGEAVSKGIVSNETLGYFLGRVYLFLTRLGIDKERLRFRQHLANEMAHYAADCWDAEIECSYGWIECVGIADRSAFDLRAHAAMDEKEAMEMKAVLETKGELEFHVCTLGKAVSIKSNMVSISKVIKKEHQRVFTPSVIEPSFGIGRIIYCLFEHSFHTRPSKASDEQLNVFRFPPLVAPIKCTVFPLVQNPKYEEVAKKISKSLTAGGIFCETDSTGSSIGKKYARADEIGMPFAITVDSVDSVTIRERDSRDQIRVKVEDVRKVVKKLISGRHTWPELQRRYPA
ncbi:hypothetical protein GIB67_004137 [Kingdonia uniflora]|uniref:glycine--tRNA ligase n=1 Tax=Kingdonia uniflora TaxID=39325 RepID=A0A7J7NRC6_9MAGN|nr:hypothetical protein GIB67_004137 [Kingdonia uniflora]